MNCGWSSQVKGYFDVTVVVNVVEDDDLAYYSSLDEKEIIT